MTGRRRREALLTPRAFGASQTARAARMLLMADSVSPHISARSAPASSMHLTKVTSTRPDDRLNHPRIFC